MNEVILEIPEGRYSESEVLSIHKVKKYMFYLADVSMSNLYFQKYKQLPGVLLVRPRTSPSQAIYTWTRPNDYSWPEAQKLLANYLIN